MAQHDYKIRKRKSGRRASRTSTSSGWAWLFVGLAIGLFGGFLFYLSKRPAPLHHELFGLPSAEKQPAKVLTKAPVPPAVNPQGPTAPEKPKFDFYTLLPKLHVEVPPPAHPLVQGHGQTAVPTKPVSTGSSHPAIPNRVKAPGRYMLQIASFGTEGQANVMKAKLAFQGIVAKVNPGKVKNYTWYRVQVGPYSDLAKLNAMLAHFAKEHIKPLVIKMN